jgi:hypothetical protein
MIQIWSLQQSRRRCSTPSCFISCLLCLLGSGAESILGHVGKLTPAKRVFGNYDPLQSELADNPTLRALRDYFRFARDLPGTLGNSWHSVAPVPRGDCLRVFRQVTGGSLASLCDCRSIQDRN